MQSECCRQSGSGAAGERQPDPFEGSPQQWGASRISCGHTVDLLGEGAALAVGGQTQEAPHPQDEATRPIPDRGVGHRAFVSAVHPIGGVTAGRAGRRPRQCGSANAHPASSDVDRIDRHTHQVGKQNTQVTTASRTPARSSPAHSTSHRNDTPPRWTITESGPEPDGVDRATGPFAATIFLPADYFATFVIATFSSRPSSSRLPSSSEPCSPSHASPEPSPYHRIRAGAFSPDCCPR